MSESSSQVSQTSQSSIEVIDSTFNSRKPSEERRISIVPTLDTIEDDGQRNEEAVLDETLTSSALMKKSDDEVKAKVVLSIGNVNLTESSSSGSVCESVVTAYEHKKEKVESGFDGIFKSSSILLSKTPKPKRESETVQSHPIQYNYDDLSVVDHRVKLFLFQNILEENDEKLMWIVKTLVIEDDPTSTGVPFFSLVVMSTKKIYVLKTVGEEGEEIASWLKKSQMFTIDRIEKISEIASKAGFTFSLKSKSAVHLLLPDQNVTDRLRIHITTSSELHLTLNLRQFLFNLLIHLFQFKA